MSFSDEEIQYRTPLHAIRPAQPVTPDEVNFDTLKGVHKLLAEALDDLDKWHAFDLKKEEGLTVEQQIAVHRRVYQVLFPVVDAVASAIEAVDIKYRER